MSSQNTNLKYSFGPTGNSTYTNDSKPMFLIYFSDKNPDLLKNRYQISFLNKDYNLLTVSDQKDNSANVLELKSLKLGEKVVKGDIFTFDLKELRSAGIIDNAITHIKEKKVFLYGSVYKMENPENINKLEIVSEKLNLQLFNILKYDEHFYSFTNKDSFPAELKQEIGDNNKIKSKFLKNNFRRFFKDTDQIYHYLYKNHNATMDTLLNNTDKITIEKVEIMGRDRTTTSYDKFTLYKGTHFLTNIADYLKDKNQEDKNTHVLDIVNELLMFVNATTNNTLIEQIKSINETTVYLNAENKFKFSNLVSLTKQNDNKNIDNKIRLKMGIFSILYKYYKCEDNAIPESLKKFINNYDIINNKIIVDTDLLTYITNIESNINTLCDSELEDQTQSYGEAEVNNTAHNSVLTSNRKNLIMKNIYKKFKNNKAAEKTKKHKEELINLKDDLQNALINYQKIKINNSKEEKEKLQEEYEQKKRAFKDKINTLNISPLQKQSKSLYNKKTYTKNNLTKWKKLKKDIKQFDNIKLQLNEVLNINTITQQKQKKNNSLLINSNDTNINKLKGILNNINITKLINDNGTDLNRLKTKLDKELKNLQSNNKFFNTNIQPILNNISETKKPEAQTLLKNTRNEIVAKIEDIQGKLIEATKAEAQRKAAEEAKAKTEADAAEAAAKAKAKAEAEQRKADEVAKAKAEAEAQRQSEAVAIAKAKDLIHKQILTHNNRLEEISTEINAITTVAMIETFTALLEKYPDIRKYCTAIIGFYAMDESTRDAGIFKDIKTQLENFKEYDKIDRSKLNEIHTLEKNEIIKALCVGFKNGSYLNADGENLKQLLDKMNELKLNLPEKLDDILETVLKIPGIIVKIIDDPQAIEADNEKFVKGVNNCVEIGSGCDELTEAEKGKYGPYRFVADPSQKYDKYTNPPNTDVFYYLRDNYNLEENILYKNAKLKLFGYGFSGSGKTYTLLQGSDKDPSLLTQVIKYCKELDKTVSLSIDMFYPDYDNNITATGSFYQIKDEQGQIMKGELNTKVNEINTEIIKQAFDIRRLLEQIEEDILAKYLLVLPTTNNPKSSRAFTIVNLNIGNVDKKIQFIDLPGLEKKVDMIKDHYYPTEKKESISDTISKKNVQPANSGYAINSVDMPNSEFTTFFSNIKFTFDKLKKSLYISNNSFYVNDMVENMKEYLTMYLKIAKKSGGSGFIIPYSDIEVTAYKPDNIFANKLKLQKKEQYAEYLKEYLLEFILYTNYTTELKASYIYELPDDAKLEKYVLDFKNTFLNKNDYKNFEEEKEKITTVKGFESTFNLVFKCTVTNTESTEYFILDTNDIKIIEYKSPALSCLNVIISILDNLISNKEKNKLIYLKFQVLFMVMFTKFTLRQGEAIVTSLEHLLFEFLNQTPGGLTNYNNKQTQDQDKKFKNTDNTEYKYETRKDNKYQPGSYIIPGDKTASGMPETVNRKYLEGMKKILDIDEYSRFINLLAILRRSKARDGDNTAKRCTGAQETLEFGSTLINANNALCTGEVKIDRIATDGNTAKLAELDKEKETILATIKQLNEQLNPAITTANSPANNPSPAIMGGNSNKKYNTKRKSFAARINTHKTKKNKNKNKNLQSKKVNISSSNYRSKKKKKKSYY